MTSRKEEERNEKIIRGLMKLPPNRRCINCNSLGPQYVCTNFWTFVCTTCSGIHREFTHRVKSVSMSKFTSQEVDALQKGGNQRAKEFFLKDWDSQRHRFPDSSNAVNVREFINKVYVKRQYAGGRTSDRPPRDMQNLGNHDDEVRRASSYHSYSQSPPYDFQYEERRYGKHTHVLSRKPGSDRGLYEGKFSSFLSPTRSSDHVYEDEFANGGASSRVSDYSVSSGGDPFRSGTQSPNSQRDIKFSSPSIETSRDKLHKDVQHQTVSTFSDANNRKSADGIPHPQRTTSLGSFGSFDSNSTSCKSVNSSGLVEVALGPGQCVETSDRKLHNVSSLAQSSLCGNYDGQDLFNVPSAPQAVDLFQLPKTSSTPSIDLFQPSSISSASTLNTHQPSQSSSFSLVDSFSHMPTQPSAATLNEKAPDMVATQDEGWATFDVPQHVAPNVNVENFTPATVSSSTDTSLGNFEPHLSFSTSLQWPSFQDTAAHGPASVPYLWHEVFHPVQASVKGSNIQSWNAFEDPTKHMPLEGSQRSSNQIAVHNPSFADEFLEKRASKVLYEDGIHKTGSDPPFAGVASHVSESLNMSAALNYMEGANSHATDCKSTNPFDLPYASDPESSNTFLDMYSLQAAVPNVQMPSPFIGAVSQPWFSQDQVTPYTSTGPQGGLGFMEVQASGTQLSNVHSQGPVGSFGNPFV